MKESIARMIDFSAVRAESTIEEIDQIILAAREHRFICVFTMPSFAAYTIDQLKNDDDILVGGVVGFPSGAETTEAKVFQAQQLKELGCDEIDMVINIGKLKSAMYDDVLSDIIAVKKAVAPLSLKVIIEVVLLNDEQIVKASELVLVAGADYVKTGTGWAGATTVEHVKLIKDTVGDRINVKVAGGVRDLATLNTMKDMGVNRFGIGYKAALSIMDEYNSK